jgi:hypothetical protein
MTPQHKKFKTRAHQRTRRKGRRKEKRRKKEGPDEKLCVKRVFSFRVCFSFLFCKKSPDLRGLIRAERRAFDEPLVLGNKEFVGNLRYAGTIAIFI